MTDPDYNARDDDRSRLVAAFSKAAGEQGYVRLDPERVSRYAGLPPGGFQDHFETVEQALVVAQEAFFERIWLDLLAACEAPPDWPLKVRAGVTSVISSLSEASGLARVFAIEGPGASLAAAERQFAAVNRLAALLSSGRELYPRARALPAITERALIGGGVSIVSEHLLDEDPKAIPALRPELIELFLTPYLGEDEARRLAAA